MRRRFGKIAILGTLAAMVVFGLLLDLTPPQSVTLTRMHVTKRRILRFAAAHGALPTSP